MFYCHPSAHFLHNLPAYTRYVGQTTCIQVSVLCFTIFTGCMSCTWSAPSPLQMGAHCRRHNRQMEAVMWFVERGVNHLLLRCVCVSTATIDGSRSGLSGDLHVGFIYYFISIKIGELMRKNMLTNYIWKEAKEIWVPEVNKAHKLETNWNQGWK